MNKVTPDLSSVTVVGLDLAKLVFQVHCVDAGGGRNSGDAILNRHQTNFDDGSYVCTPRISASQ